MTVFLICGQLMRHPFLELFRLFILLQMPSDHRTVDVEFLGNFSYSCNRISFHDGSQLVLVDFQWPATMLFIFKALVSFAELLESALSCSLVSSSWASYIVDVVSCLHSFITNFEPTAQYPGYYPEIKLTLPALEARSLNQQTTREVPLCVFAFFFSCFNFFWFGIPMWLVAFDCLLIHVHYWTSYAFSNS